MEKCNQKRGDYMKQFIQMLEQEIEAEYKNIAGITVIRQGKTVYEQGFHEHTAEDTLHVASITKSIISALIGVAIDKGYIKSVDQKVLDYFPEYDPGFDETKKQVTIKHLLTMTAPYSYEEEPFEEFCMSSNWVTYVLDVLDGEKPMGTFQYSTAGIHLLSAILTKATGKSAREFANEMLFKPVGMHILPDLKLPAENPNDFFYRKEAFGWISDPQGINTGGWGITLSARDLALFGELYLRKGEWNGKQIISKVWIEESTKLQQNNYGYLWWRFDDKEPMICALGDGGNIVCCLPERDMAVGITAWFEPNAKEPFEMIEKLADNL